MERATLQAWPRSAKDGEDFRIFLSAEAEAGGAPAHVPPGSSSDEQSHDNRCSRTAPVQDEAKEHLPAGSPSTKCRHLGDFRWPSSTRSASGWRWRETLHLHWLTSSWTSLVVLWWLLISSHLASQVAGTVEYVGLMSQEGGTYINCGGSEFTRQNITWIPDAFNSERGYTFRMAEGANVTLLADSGPDVEVFRTMRYFGSQWEPVNSYSIQVPRVGYYIVRLFFAEILYKNTSLRRFNVSIEGAQVLREFQLPQAMAAVRKEFYVPVTDGQVDISFIRGSVGDPMISGIGVIPVQDLAYGLNASLSQLVLATQTRLSCGANETYMDLVGRTWVTDSGYFSPAHPKSVVLDSIFSSAPINGTETEPDWLPSTVYDTLRSTVNRYEEETNFTALGVPRPQPLVYTIRVDPNEEYHLKLGFNEMLVPWKGARLMNVTIDEQQVAALLDVAGLAGERNVHFLGVNVMSNSSSYMSVAVSIGALTGYTRDAFLSTLEVFKIHTTDPWVAAYLLGKREVPPDSSIVKGVFIGIAIGVVVAIIVIFIFLLLLHIRQVRKDRELGLKTPWIWFRHRIRAKDRLVGSERHSSSGSVRKAESATSTVSRLGRLGCQAFSYEALKGATKDFAPEVILGRGGFGEVFRATLGGQEVAVKRLRIGSRQGEREFLNEVDLLSRLHHRHLVNLVGYCSDKTLALVYEYIPNGTLREHLRDEEKAVQLQWRARLQIAIGAARGLEYLHRGANPPVIHRDIKTSNILLDKDLEAKVADFGLSKLGQLENSHTLDMGHVSTNVKGTLGYLDPMYYSKRQLTEKSDVYSLGIVLLELLTGRVPIWNEVDSDEHAGGRTRLFNLVEWALPFLAERNLKAIVAPQLKLRGAARSMEDVAELARRCTEISDKGRPVMAEVVRRLEEARIALSEDEDKLASASAAANGFESSFVEEAEAIVWQVEGPKTVSSNPAIAEEPDVELALLTSTQVDEDGGMESSPGVLSDMDSSTENSDRGLTNENGITPHNDNVGGVVDEQAVKTNVPAKPIGFKDERGPPRVRFAFDPKTT